MVISRKTDYRAGDHLCLLAHYDTTPVGGYRATAFLG